MFLLDIINAMMNLEQFGPVVLICVETNWPGSRFTMTVLGCRSLVLVNNQVLRKIKIVIKSDVKNWAYISLR